MSKLFPLIELTEKIFASALHLTPQHPQLKESVPRRAIHAFLKLLLSSGEVPVLAEPDFDDSRDGHPLSSRPGRGPWRPPPCLALALTLDGKMIDPYAPLL